MLAAGGGREREGGGGEGGKGRVVPETGERMEYITCMCAARVGVGDN